MTEMKKVKLKITKNLIRKGRQGYTGCCPIALAIKQKVTQFYYYRVSVNTYSSIGGYNFPLTEVARKFMEKFDKCKKSVKPCTLELKLPAVCLK